MKKKAIDNFFKFNKPVETIDRKKDDYMEIIESVCDIIISNKNQIKKWLRL